MEWMYGGLATQDQKNNAEEYLLGKPVEKIEHPGRPDATGYVCIRDNTQTFDETHVNYANEDFVKVREDPLYEMKKEEMKRKEEIMNNPVIMQKLYHSVAGGGVKSLGPGIQSRMTVWNPGDKSKFTVFTNKDKEKKREEV